MARLKKFIDIGANLTDPMFRGIYNGSKKHDDDLLGVLQRSWSVGLEKIIITAGNLEESKKVLELANSDDRLYATVGCHPTRCLEFVENSDQYLANLKEVVLNGASKVVAIGECGLDYDRLQFCPKDVQKKFLQVQLELSRNLKLPLFLHCRNAAQDLHEILSRYTDLKGVVHSFDGTIEEARYFIDLGFYIGLNGCSLKTKENLETIIYLPEDRILLETDCPWCEIRPTHAGYHLISKENKSITVKKEKWKLDSMVKGRNEPNNIGQVLDIVATVRKEDPIDLSLKIFDNTLKLFF